MFLKEFLTRRADRKNLPSVEGNRQMVFGPDIDSDRRKFRTMGVVTIICAVIILVALRDRDDTAENKVIPDPSASHELTDGSSGRCLYPHMYTYPGAYEEDTRVLQEFLQRDSYYNSPNGADGIYDEDVIEAVASYQEDARDAGRYDAVIDGSRIFNLPSYGRAILYNRQLDS